MQETSRRAGHVELELASDPTPEVRALVDELETALSERYPPEQRHGLSVEALFQPHLRFFVARVGGSAVGCGGVALFSDFAEVKRMYVREGFRGQGIADAILARLEEEALGADLWLMRLETGTCLVAANRFYARCGYLPCEAFEPYASMAPHTIVASAFLEKRLDPGGHPKFHGSRQPIVR